MFSLLILLQKAQLGAVKELNGTEPLFSDDTYLKPVIEDDPLLRKFRLLCSLTSLTSIELQADEWSDSEDEQIAPNGRGISEKSLDQKTQLRHAQREARNLKERLAAAQQDLNDYRSLVNTKIADIAARELGSDTIKQIREEPAPKVEDRDDDTHYFQSYAEHSKRMPPFSTNIME
jgi:protein arginine N-methyltransferase 3